MRVPFFRCGRATIVATGTYNQAVSAMDINIAKAKPSGSVGKGDEHSPVVADSCAGVMCTDTLSDRETGTCDDIETPCDTNTENISASVPALKPRERHGTGKRNEHEKLNDGAQPEQARGTMDDGSAGNVMDINERHCLGGSQNSSERDADEDTYDWEMMMGSGHWDSNGGSPQWVPAGSSDLENVEYTPV